VGWRGRKARATKLDTGGQTRAGGGAQCGQASCPGAGGRRRVGSAAGSTKAAADIVVRTCRIRGAGILVE
jgi:hypothetical protein